MLYSIKEDSDNNMTPITPLTSYENMNIHHNEWNDCIATIDESSDDDLFLSVIKPKIERHSMVSYMSNNSMLLMEDKELTSNNAKKVRISISKSAGQYDQKSIDLYTSKTCDII